MSDQNPQSRSSWIVRLFSRLQKTFFSFLNGIAQSITSSVHIPDIAIGPIVGSLITSLTTLIIGFVTLSNLFSEQFLYRPLQLQDNNAHYTLEVDQYQQKVLTDYLNYTAKLLLDYPLQQIQENHYLLRSLTQSTLAKIDGERKRYVVMFLADSMLLEKKYYPISSLLEGSNLQEAQLQQLNLTSLNLKYADFTKSDLSQTKLNKSDLSHAVLKETNLTNSDLRGVDLQEVTLANTKLENACFDRFTIFPEDFDPEKAKMKLINTFDTCPLINTKSQTVNLKAIVDRN